ncbi:MAG TPA: hypothetical protein VGH37_11150 [Candidatus Acidoferrum sp.]
MGTEIEKKAPELPLYTLDVQAMDLGASTKAVGMELLETESREPLRGKEAALIWGAALPALAAKEPLVVDFFSHLERVREYCKLHELKFREAASRCLVATPTTPLEVQSIFERFEKETFGIRVGAEAEKEDPTVEGELSQRGVDAYQNAYTRYTFCAVCEPEDGWVTLLSEGLWASEVIRRVRPALQGHDVYLVRPQ